ncbi:MAG TPA: sulfite exporter TauE/SafE family protein [Gemmatimonadales bacterium]|nr:sulfite exporter TauE/SafE family protein [Gemmatimonadales bacterium]
MFGIGGGVVIVAALVGVAGFPIHKATGTSLAALLLPVGLLGAMEYWRRGHVDLKAAMIIAAGLAIGAWFGARAAQHVNGTTLQRGFAIFLVLIAARMWMKAGS